MKSLASKPDKLQYNIDQAYVKLFIYLDFLKIERHWGIKQDFMSKHPVIELYRQWGWYKEFDR